jgi:UDP-GlcNAc:undecaprenyl-phosphate GlcNAc-1-phosphate transferase
MNIYFLFILLINIIILIFHKKFIKLINIFDEPDRYRKKHLKKTSLSGGSIIFLNLIMYFLYFYIYKNLQEFSNLDYISLFIGSFIFYLLGLYDDKYSISANKKLFIQFLFAYMLIFFNDNLLITQLNFFYNSFSFSLGYYSLIFTIMCVLLLVNSLNMFDGINLQSGILCIIIFTILAFHSGFSYLLITLIISCVFFLILNYQNKTFLGNNGILLLGYIISFFLIRFSNNKEILFLKVEEILILLLIPGLDMFRLFILRISKKKNPFLGDRNHIHHILTNKFTLIRTTFIIQSLIIFPQLIIYFFSLNRFIVIFLVILIYTFLIKKYAR